VHLGAAVSVGERAHGLLDRGLHLEHQPGGGTAADVEEPPVLAALGAGVGVDGERRLGAVLDGDGGRDELEAAEADGRVGRHPPGYPDGGLDGQSFQAFLQWSAVAPVGDLDGAAMVADDHELEGALQPEGVRPAGDGNGLADVTVQVGS
jgi:hypothetical protein